MTVELNSDARAANGSRLGEPARFRYAVRPGAVSSDNLRAENPIGGHVIIATNSDYGFRIYRKRAEASWVLADAAPNTGSGEFWATFAAREAVESVRKAGLTLGLPGESLPDLAGDKEFVVTGVTQEARDGTPLTRVEFRNTPRFTHRVTDATSTRPPRQIDVVSGHVLLDPKRYWLIHSFAVRMAAAAAERKGQVYEMIGTHTYTTLRDGLPVVERVERRILPGPESGPGNESTVVYRYDEAVPAESEFRLTKYGLPEPFGLRRPTPWYLWAIAAAAVLFAAGAVFRRLAGRRAAAMR